MNRPRPIAILAAIAGASAAFSQTPIYTEDFTGALGTLPSGWSAFSENSAVLATRNDGASEYEHRLVADNTADLRAVSYYADTAVTDNGVWRDTQVSALLRYSGAANNQNGLIARARGLTATGGDFYHARLNGDLIQLFRFNNGTSTLLGSVATPSLATIVDRLFVLTTANIPTAGTDQVQLRVELYNGATLVSGVMQSLDVVDTSASALTRAGGAGVRSFHPIAANSGQRATFDNFQVTSQHPQLLWYDDHADNVSLRTETFTSGGATATVANQRRDFGLTANSSVTSLLDFDARTSQSDWADVMASTTLRLNTNIAPGGSLAGSLILRETAVASAGGTGSFYAYRLLREENTGAHQAALYRVNNGVETLLTQTALADAAIPESANLFLEFQAQNVLNGVSLQARYALDPLFATPLGVLSVTDTDASRLSGPGSAGVRAEGFAGLVNGAMNFDNFTVTALVPEPSTFALCLAGLPLVLRLRRPWRNA